jgi:anaerobic dimethyl sulfoxide reductase subunit B (iron-sulfur subunit)
MQIGFYFNQSRCTGCYACLIACKDWHDTPDAEPQDWIKIIPVEKGKFPEPSLAYLFLTCLHCKNPACAEACPVGAISKRENDGVVIVDRDICLGYSACGDCRTACPYDIPRFGAGQDARMEKCDMCIERMEDGKKPICVEACPMRALDVGPLDDLRAKYSSTIQAEGFSYSNEHIPSICFKYKQVR